MSTTKNLSSMKSRLTIYKLGLRRAETHGNQDEITKWESSIAALEQEIDELDNSEAPCPRRAIRHRQTAARGAAVLIPAKKKAAQEGGFFGYSRSSS